MPLNLCLAFCFQLLLCDSLKKKLCSKEGFKPYSVTVIDRILNSLSLKSYDISYRFSTSLK